MGLATIRAEFGRQLQSYLTDSLLVLGRIGDRGQHGACEVRPWKLVRRRSIHSPSSSCHAGLYAEAEAAEGLEAEEDAETEPTAGADARGSRRWHPLVLYGSSHRPPITWVGRMTNATVSVSPITASSLLRMADLSNLTPSCACRIGRDKYRSARRALMMTSDRNP